MSKQKKSERMLKPVELNILFDVHAAVKDGSIEFKTQLADSLGSFISERFKVEAEDAKDMVRDAILSGNVIVAKRYPEISETLVKRYNDLINQSNFRGICRFKRVVFASRNHS